MPCGYTKREKLHTKSAFSRMVSENPYAPPINITTSCPTPKAFSNLAENSGDDIFSPRSSQQITYSRPLNGHSAKYLSSFSSDIKFHDTPNGFLSRFSYSAHASATHPTFFFPPAIIFIIPLLYHRRPEPSTHKKRPLKAFSHSWLGRQDSNLRMLGPKPSALPLGDGLILQHSTTKTKLSKPCPLAKLVLLLPSGHLSSLPDLLMPRPRGLP